MATDVKQEPVEDSDLETRWGKNNGTLFAALTYSKKSHDFATFSYCVIWFGLQEIRIKQQLLCCDTQKNVQLTMGIYLNNVIVKIN